MKKIGIFGGAFDPPHNAHTALAHAALNELKLDALYVIPTGQAWHKTRTLSAPEHRLAMTRLAFQKIPGAVVDDREIKRAGPSFTIDTLRVLQSENPDAQLYLIMGADQFAAFRQWHQWQAIVEFAIICIAERAQFYWAEGQFDAFKELKNRFLSLPMQHMPVSATQIRQSLASGSGESGVTGEMVSESVARYISLHRLYGPR